MKIGELITESEPTGQFRLIDVFGMVTVAAVLLATLTPLLRLMNRDLSFDVTAAAMMQVVIQVAVVLIAIATAIGRRMQLQKRAGRRFGVAFCGSTKSEYWPRMKSIFVLIGLILIQLVFVAMHFWRQGASLLILHSVQLAFVCGGAVVNFVWKSYPGTIEFFESGIAVKQVFYPWTDVELLNSTTSSRMRVIVRGRLTSAPHVSRELEAIADPQP